jgi:hypothetical protein
LRPVFFPKAKKSDDKGASLTEIPESELVQTESSRNVEFDGRAAVTASIITPSNGSASSICDTDVFLSRPFANIAAHSPAENEHYFLNSSLVTAVPSINAFAVA